MSIIRIWKQPNGKFPIHIVPGMKEWSSCTWISFLDEKARSRYFIRSGSRWAFVNSYPVDSDPWPSRFA